MISLIDYISNITIEEILKIDWITKYNQLAFVWKYKWNRIEKN